MPELPLRHQDGGRLLESSGAAPAPTGLEVVERMTGGRPWWKLQAADIAPWIRSLPDAVRTCRYNRLEWIGRAWDGVSNLALGHEPCDESFDVDFGEPLWEYNGDDDAVEVVSATELMRLIAELRHLISENPALGVRLPDHRSVRACLIGPEGSVSDPTDATLTIDFDLGAFVVPLCIDDWQLRPHTMRPMVEVAALMFRKLVHAAKHRRCLLRRELRMRKAFEAIMTDIGDGAAPLWLRMEPLRVDAADDDMAFLPYVAFDIRLDLHQVWAPNGLERVRNPARLARNYERCASAHRRKVAQLREMEATCSEGWITDVALGMIEARGLNPIEVFRQERDAGLNRGSHTSYGVGGRFGALFCHDGILQPYFDVGNGTYNGGKLTIQGTFPATLASGAGGQPLAAVVDHPAFVLSGATIERAEWHEHGMEFHHTPRLVTVEEAERRWIAARAETALRM